MLPERVAATVNIGSWCCRYCVLITDVLDTAREQAIFGRGGSLEFPFPVAVDEELRGVSRQLDHRLTRDVTVGVGRQLRSHTAQVVDGVTGAAPIFHAVMLAATQRLHGAAGFDARAIVAVPDGIAEREVCSPACRRTLVPGAPARTVATGQRSALQLASLERRRPARHLAAGAPPVGEAERPDDRDGASSDERFDPSRRCAAATDRSTSARDREPSSRRDLPDRSDAQA